MFLLQSVVWWWCVGRRPFYQSFFSTISFFFTSTTSFARFFPSQEFSSRHPFHRQITAAAPNETAFDREIAREAVAKRLAGCSQVEVSRTKAFFKTTETRQGALETFLKDAKVQIMESRIVFANKDYAVWLAEETDPKKLDGAEL